MTIKKLIESMQNIKNLDQSSLDYYESQYFKLVNFEQITIKLTDYSGNSTHFHNLNVESIIFLLKICDKVLDKKSIK